MTVRRADWRVARAEAAAAARALPRALETVPLAESAGRTLAHDVTSLARVPGSDVSAMDGWAVTGEGPWRLGPSIVAGRVADGADPLPPGIARPVTTGAVVPTGTDRVLRSESGHVADDVLTADDDPRRPSHVRRAGEEIDRGDALIAAGTLLTPPRVAVLALGGHDAVSVVVRPAVALAVLGDEVVAEGVPGPGTVRDVFSVPVPRLLDSLGAAPATTTRVPDDLDATIAALDRPDRRLVVTTGGTAHGPTDHVRAALDRLGAELVVDGLAMRPGQPLVVARRGETLYLCLPGNPMAAYVGLVVVGTAVVDGLLGRRPAPPGSVTLAVDVAHPRAGALVQAYRLTPDGAVPTERQSSAMLRGLADADGLLIVPEGGARAGDVVPSLGLPW
ncbi:molybdopterin molybdotransferase MoeA [Frigoribacterium sp. R86507]|uniref:molybdopterin molybdotransferase MoeA n=1 Tax=Frigoribacterium sp. R86507 TaxID=3093850 RepID=UPI0037C87ABA